MGKPIASNVSNPRTFNSPELLKGTIEEGKRFAELENGGNGKILLMALPVIWVMTNKPEGILVAEVRLDELFNKTLPSFDVRSDRSVSLVSGQNTILQNTKRAEASSFQMTKPLKLQPPLDKMAFQFEIYDYRKIRAEWLAVIYFVVGVLFIGVTLRVSKAISLMLLGRLVVLSEAAKRISESGSFDLAPEVEGYDEVAALGSAFNAMIEKVREAHDSLERRVEERTEQLLRTNEELNNEISERQRVEEKLRQYHENLEELVKKRTEELSVLNEQLQRAEKMEALGLLAGGVAHDLNNVLGVIIGYSDLLLYAVDESNPLRPSLLNIMEGGQRAAAIVEDLLTLARRGVSGRQVLNLNKIVADCQKSPEFKKLSSYHSSIQIKTALEPDLLNISGSYVHLSKTLFNLVSNANEAMPKGGFLTIKTANQYLDRPIQRYDEVKEGDYVVLSVSDTGEGIPAADVKRIFDPFYTKKVMGRSGTGLGLAVVWGTVKDHHGYINVQSEEEKGSIFTLYFPVTREEITTESIAVSISEYMGKDESILIVDDVAGQRDLATEMLRKLNYSVASVDSGEEAVAYLQEHKVDLIVLDFIMDPGMDGLDTYKSVLEVYPKQKAIIVSGFSESERVNAAQALGAGAYVRKPYVIEKLGMAVRKELDRAT
jgi:signal transduction histidine kinase/ActR/RegA family two-component response regulator